MAETHQEIVKVWIAPGCIVCDSCETDCPEVFEVQEETCVIRPDAEKEDFTKPLTPSIIVAAEGCPTEVIKYETVEVEGPEPWAGQEQEVAAGATAGGGGGHAAAAPAAAIPEGPPDPKWAGLLSDSEISHRGRSDTADEAPRTAKVPLEVLAAALPSNAPPDARAAAAVGSGYASPRPGVLERIHRAASSLASTADANRRQFNFMLAIGWGALAVVGGTCAAALQAFMVPKVIREPPPVFRAGKLSDYPEPGVYERFKDSQGVWIVHLKSGQLIAVNTTCTHLGCIPNWLANDQKFKCPCHGSGFQVDGVNFEGPAPRPLEHYMIYLEGPVVIVDKSRKYRQELGQWDSPESFVTL